MISENDHTHTHTHIYIIYLNKDCLFTAFTKISVDDNIFINYFLI